MQTINRVLINSVAIDLASDSILHNLILKFKESEYLKLRVLVQEKVLKEKKRTQSMSRRIIKNDRSSYILLHQ